MRVAGCCRPAFNQFLTQAIAMRIENEMGTYCDSAQAYAK